MKKLLFIFIWLTSWSSFSQVVTSAANAGPGTLREAIDNATGGEVITFAPALTGATIDLTASLTPIVGLTIDGEDKDIKVSGGNIAGPFHVSGSFNLNLQNFTIENGGGVSVGGGIFAESGASLVLENMVIRNCNGNNGGGAIRSVGGSHIFKNVEFIGNYANTGWGGAYYLLFGSAYFENCLFSGNSANHGGATYLRGGSTFVNCTFSGNLATGNAGCFYVDNGQTVTVRNSVCWNNQTAFGIGTFHAFYQVEGGGVITMLVEASDIQGSGGSLAWNAQYGSDVGGNIDSDPNFAITVAPSTAPTLGGNYRPQDVSQTHDSALLPYVTTSLDLDQHTRVHNGSVDMGCYEFCSTYDTLNITVCDSYVSPSGVYTYTFGGVYSDTLSNMFGCDSVITIFLDVNNTYNTFSDTACDVYIAPSGATYAASGTYNDTIANMAGCDSIMTINVTVNSTTYNSISINECFSATSPSGNYVWISDGVYNDTIPNSTGCDSVITATVDILNNTSTITEVHCDSYSSPAGNNYTTTGIYKDTIPNNAGCDSVITINLTINNSTTSTIAPSACEFYVTPSGANTHTSSGTYVDIIPNAAGCDSTITIDLTILDHTSSTINEVACDTYTSPSGLYTYSSSLTFNDTILNVAGCDSVITINLTITNETYATHSPTVCDSLLSPSGLYVWSTSGQYFDTIPNFAGCDSIMTFNLIVNSSTYSTITETACDNYVSPSAVYLITASGQYQDTIPNSTGCDSIITINLTINNSTNSVIDEIVCHSYVSPSGNYTWTSSGAYKDTIVNAVGCDSVITINLEVQSNSSILDTSSCDIYTSPSGLYVYDQTGTYLDTLTNVAGCDSVITIYLLINDVISEIELNDISLKAINLGDGYQWFDCDDSIIVDSSGQETFTPTSDGYYALILSSSGCVDTSECIFIDVPEENPTAFSPNGDGINDFLILEIDDPVNTVYIYNRWGDKVATLVNYDNVEVAWDGRMSNGKVFVGTYFYVFESATEQKVGWIQVVN